VNSIDLAALAQAQTLAHVELKLQRVILLAHHDPFCVLGRQNTPDGEIIRTVLPLAHSAHVSNSDLTLNRIPGSVVFECLIGSHNPEKHHRIRWTDDAGHHHEFIDPYTFPPQIGDFDLHLFGEGKNWDIHRVLGAHPHTIDEVEGVLFATWAPNAERISVVGEFNNWDGRCHPMRARGSSGVWELFIPEIKAGACYKFEIRNRQSGDILLKTDPYGQQFALRPDTDSIVTATSAYPWTDETWLTEREHSHWAQKPMSIYEIHLGSWRKDAEGSFLNFREIVQQLVTYIHDLGFTHVELLPITEHPLDASWGYQTTGYFAPTSRFGSPDDFRYFVDYCHQHDIGVILDWVPAHFPKDAHGLANYDGTPLYEHEDPRLGEHRDWGTLIYNFGRNEVKNFLISSAMFWIEEFHLDGLRVDAVASMLYLDYSRQPGDWIPNKYGGNENLEAIAFLRELNTVIHQQHPGSVIIAEESTAWPQVTRPTWTGGLGFSMKWNMGWMHDTLLYMSKDPIHRHFHHDQLTFGLLYAFTENFVLPFSHDEVVHGKGSMLQKMPGDEWRRFANLRALYTLMFTYPGKKLLFMGCEFAQGSEWNHAQPLDWHLLQLPFHRGVSTLVSDLNRLYKNFGALHRYDFESKGFEWVDCHDATQSVLSYIRKDETSFLVVILNLTPIPRIDYRIGVPEGGTYIELLNSDSAYYGGSNMGNVALQAEAREWMGRLYSIRLTLPPLAGLVLTLKPEPVINYDETTDTDE
jgi:1,4-alpha-glucan branching enzyme